MTAFRIVEESDSFYYFTGRTFDDGKKTFNGSRGWVKDLKLCREPVKVLDLMNTILEKVYAHHYPMVLKDVSSLIEELAWWLELKRVQKVEYQDYQYVP